MKNRIVSFIWVFVLALTACRVDQTEPDRPVAPDRGEASFCSAVSDIPEPECEALVSFYNSTGGSDWRLNRGWLDTAQPCDWAGLTCANGHVMAITINDNDLRGSLPPELGHLSKLETLVLYFNYLEGELPPELGRLSDLRVLILHDNKLSGPLPPELGRLSRLEELDLQANKLSGRIPVELGKLANLKRLNLNNNDLSGPIPPELGDLTNLRGLFLAGNNLTGRVPPELGKLSNVWLLNLNYNHLSGDLPDSLQDLPGSGYDFINRLEDKPGEQEAE
jgi:hypothetical protein